MKKRRFLTRTKLSVIALALPAAAVLSLQPAFASTPRAPRSYVQTNLVSDIPGLAAHTDPNLVNPWGMTNGPGSPLWVSDNHAGVSTVYDGAGNAFPQPPGTPTVVAVADAIDNSIVLVTLP